MKILLLHQYFLEKDEGGGTRFNEMANHWEKAGHDITVISGMVYYTTGKKKDRYKKKYIYHEQYSSRITVYRCHVPTSYNKNFKGRLKGYLSFVFSSLYCGLFRTNEQYDVIIVTSPPLFIGITGKILSFIKGVPLIFEIRDLWPQSAIDIGVLKNPFFIKLAYWFENFMYKKAQLINTLTPAFTELLLSKNNVSPKKIMTIPNAANFDLSNQRLKLVHKKELKIKKSLEGKFLFVYAGAHGVANDVKQIIEVAKKLNDTSAHFLLIGDGMQKQSLIQHVEETGLSNVEFISTLTKEELFDYLIIADIGICVFQKAPVFEKVYTNKAFDYMSCQLPILMVIDGISKQLVEKANCGVYAEAENIEEIVTKARYLMNLPRSTRQELGMNGYHYAYKNFNRSTLAHLYLDAIKNVALKS